MDEDSKKTLIGVRELAALFDLSDRRIQQLTADGVLSPEIVTVKGHSTRMYDLLPTVHDYVVHLQAKIRGIHRTDKEIELREQKMAADIALKESQGELHRLKTQIAAGEYISIEEVKMDYARFFLTFKKFAMSLPARVTGMASGSLDPVEARRIEKELSGEITSLLTSFAVSGVVQPADVKGILDAAKGKKQNDEEVEDEVSGN